MSILDVIKTRDRLERAKKVVESPNKFLNIPDAMKIWMNAWPNQSTKNDVLRASGIYYVCPREYVLNYWQPQANKSFDWASQLKMSTGTHLHDYFQNYVFGPMGILHGTWVEFKGSGVENKTEGFHPDPDKALHEISNQKPLTYRYVEPKVWNGKYRISGHIDGLIDSRRVNWIHKSTRAFKNDPLDACNQLHKLEGGDKFLLEIKTVSRYQFDKLGSDRDIADYYKMQACIYQKLSKVLRTVFLYVERDTMRCKVLIYSYDQGWWKEATRKAKIIWRSVRDETLPESMMKCVCPKDTRAKKCVFAEPCWKKNLDFVAYVEKGKEIAKKEGRKLLDLSGWKE